MTGVQTCALPILYAYLSWTRKKYNEKRLKKGKKIRNDDKYDDIIIPIIVAVLAWFIAYGYINYKKSPQQMQPSLPPNYRLVVDQPSEIHKSFTLVTNGIKLPIQEPVSIAATVPITQQQQQVPMFGGNNNFQVNRM